MNRLVLVLSVSVLLSGCGVPGGGDTDDPCARIAAAVSACEGEVPADARCAPGAVEAWDRLGLDRASCETIGGLASEQSALFSCDAGEHACGWFFCCETYRITWFPKVKSDWDIVSAIQKFQAKAPSKVSSTFAWATADDLDGGVSVSYTQKIGEANGVAAKDMAVHVSKIRIRVPFDEFRKILPAADRGVNLAHYLGGEVRVYQRDAWGRVTRQLERMVLSPLPLDYEAPLTNNDMTKVEVIQYTSAADTVYWRVRYSNNGTTETDVGSVDFRPYDSASTLVTFHSAHRLRALGGIPLPNWVVAPMLEKTFLDFLRNYQTNVEKAYYGW